ncbi:helix-turn-helix domain-containing protein [Methylobacterium sp. JK268]
MRGSAFQIMRRIRWDDPPPPDARSTDVVLSDDEIAARAGGAHVRAGRALLGWSMQQLAETSGLSLSTVRRLENRGGRTSALARRRAVTALRRHGIVFKTVDGSILAIGLSQRP